MVEFFPENRENELARVPYERIPILVLFLREFFFSLFHFLSLACAAFVYCKEVVGLNRDLKNLSDVVLAV